MSLTKLMFSRWECVAYKIAFASKLAPTFGMHFNVGAAVRRSDLLA